MVISYENKRHTNSFKTLITNHPQITSYYIKMEQEQLSIFIRTMGEGGAQRVAYLLSNYLSSKYHTKIVTYYDVPPRYPVDIKKTLVHHSNWKIIRWIMFPIAIFKYHRYLKKEDVSISLSMLELDNFINIITCYFTKKQGIISVHSMPSLVLNNASKLSKILSYITFTLARVTRTPIIAVSNGVKEELVSIYKLDSNLISTLYNPLDIKEIQDLALIPVCKSQIPTIVTVGRLHPIKGQWHILRVFRKIQQIHPEYMLIIIGDGEERHYLESLANELDLKDNVLFLGWIDNPYKYISKSTVFVLSSLSEALPNVLVESMACACPIVATNCSPGIGEILGTNNTCGIISKKMSGRKYKVNEPLDDGERDLYNNLLKILENPELREKMALECKERAKLFDVQIGIQKYVELIENCVTWT